MDMENEKRKKSYYTALGVLLRHLHVEKVASIATTKKKLQIPC